MVIDGVILCVCVFISLLTYVLAYFWLDIILIYFVFI